MPNLQSSWNDTDTEIPSICAHELFEAQVLRTPNSSALKMFGRLITYSELNDYANKFANYLREQAVTRESLIGICLDRSVEMVVALLAVWKAGGAYIPLDPTYPPDRLAFMISDSKAPVLVTQSKYKHLFENDSTKVICLDTITTELDSYPETNLSRTVSPENLAYVMYTSGSTGLPKGAMILHRGLVNYLIWATSAYRVEPGRTAPVHSSVAFDLTVTSLFVPLMAGGVVELLEEDRAAQSLLEVLLNPGGLNLVKITPAHLDLIRHQILPEQAAGMTTIFVIGGENLVAETLEIWRKHAPSTRLINEYGPTETVVGCCVHEVGNLDPHTGSIPIGKPIANTRLYVLDTNLRPLPVGSVGELYIGGAGVARGYLNRPELTAERFLPDPFSQESGGRIYKTGDLARYRVDGVLEYLGRADDQVKVGGYRIELGEIEAALAAHPHVHACAVLAREDAPGVKQLVGYVALRSGLQATAAELTAFLSRRLPAHMLPVQFVFMDAIPLTANGKIDRKILPAPSNGFRNVGHGGPPRTQTEKAIAAIWSTILKVEGIGVQDDFFSLGGRSLTGTALIAKLRAAFGVPVNISSIFERPTIEGLSEVVDLLALRKHNNRSADGGARQREELDL